MDDEKRLKILIKDGNTEDLAKEILSKNPWAVGGCVIFDSIQDYIDILKDNEFYKDITEEDIKNGCFAHVHVVEYENNDYCIEYIV